MAELLPLSPIVKGDTLPLDIAWRDESGAAVDMRGVTIVFAVRVAATSTSAVLLKSWAISASDSDAELGNTALGVLSSETESIPTGSYVYSVKVIRPSSPEDIETTYVYGPVKVIDA